MRYFIANPHNGAPVDAHGIQLEPGYEVEVTEANSNLLKATYEFLMQRSDGRKPNVAKAQAKKLKGIVHWGERLVASEDPSDTVKTRVVEHAAPVASEDVAELQTAVPKTNKKSLLAKAKDAILGTDTKPAE